MLHANIRTFMTTGIISYHGCFATKAVMVTNITTNFLVTIVTDVTNIQR